MRSQLSTQAWRVALTTALAAALLLLFPLDTIAQSLSMPNPSHAVQAGLPVVPGANLGEFLPTQSGAFPFTPIDRDPTEGLRHEWMQTSTGKFGFRIAALDLPSRVPLRITLLYDSGLASSLPGIPFQEPRTAYDVGLNWQFAPVSALIVTGTTTFVVLTDRGGAIPYVKETGGTRFFPSPDRPSDFGPAEPTGDGGYRIRMSNGLLRTYRLVPSESNYWLVKEEDESGNALNFTYSGGLIQKISSTDGAWVEVFRPLWGESAPSGTNPKRIVRARDSWGRELRFGYDSVGRMTSYTDAAGKVWSITWDANDHLASLTDPLSRDVFVVTTSSTHKTTSYRLFDATTNISYYAASGPNPAKAVITKPDGGVWTYEFDVKGNTTKLTDAEGGVTLFFRSATTNDLTKITDPMGKDHTFTHDTSHRITQYQAPADDAAHTAPVWNFTYDANGRLTRALAPNSAATILGYDGSGRLTTEGIDFSADGTADATTTYTRDATKGDVTVITDPMGKITNYQYVYELDSVTQALKTYTFIVKSPCDGAVCPERKFELTYDSTSSEVVQRVKLPTAASTWSVWETRTSPRGDLKSIKDPLNNVWTITTNDAGQVTTITKPGGAAWLYQSRADGQLTRIEDPLGNVQRWEYDTAARPVRYINADNYTWHYLYDRVGRVKQRTDPESRVWKATYDAAGRMSSWEAPGSRLTQIQRFDSGRLKQRSLPGGTLELFDWDVVGNLKQMEQQTPSGSTPLIDRWTYEWDRRGLPTSLRQELSAGAGTVDKTRYWSWDLAGRLANWTDYDLSGAWQVTRDSQARITAITDGQYSSVAEYEPWSGHLTRRTHAAVFIGDVAREEQFEYDAAGRTVKVSEYTGSTLDRADRFTLDALGQVLDITDERTTPTLTATYEWDAAGRPTSITQPDGTYQGFAWSRVGVLLARSWNESGASGQDLYAYDRSSLPISAQDARGTLSFTWDFAPSDQSIGAEVTRLGTGSYPYQVKLGFDTDNRIRTVQSKEGASWIDRQVYRWTPGALDLLSSATIRKATGALHSDQRFPSGLVTPGVRSDIGGSVQWRAPLWTATLEAESGGWRRLVPGRQLAERDEARFATVALSTGERTLFASLGGGVFRSGLAIPSSYQLTPRPQPLGVVTAIEGTIDQQVPTPDFRDEEFGLPPVPSASPLTSPSQSLNSVQDDYLAACKELAAVGAPVDLRCTAMMDQVAPVKKYEEWGGAWWRNDAACSFCEPPLTGGIGPNPGRTQVQEPYKSADIHPLGVTLSNGEFVLSVEDARIPGAGADLSFTRSYRSQELYDHALGRAWYGSLLDERIATPVDTGPTWTQGDGLQVPLLIPQEYEAANNSNINVKLRKFSTGTGSAKKWYWELRRENGEIRRFRDYGNPTTPGSRPGRSYLTRVALPGASVIVIDWASPPTKSPLNGCEIVARPLRARLLACDGDTETNPASATACRSAGEPAPVLTYDATTGWPTEPATPPDAKELGRIVFKTVFDCTGYRVTEIAVKQPTSANDAWKTRKVVYSYVDEKRTDGTDVYARNLSTVATQELDAGGAVINSENVAGYKYRWQNSGVSPGSDRTITGNLVAVLAPDPTTGALGDSQWIQQITYQPEPGASVDQLLFDTVASVQTRARTVNLTYVPKLFADPNLVNIYRIGQTDLRSTNQELVNGAWVSRERLTKHEFNRDGQPTRVTNADGTSHERIYDSLGGTGRVTEEIDFASDGTANYVAKTKYKYSICHFGLCPDAPIRVGRIPKEGSTEPEAWTCYDLDYLTGTQYRTLSPEAGTTESGNCEWTPGGILNNFASETVPNWMLAPAAASGSGDQTTDTALDAYLDRWALTKELGANAIDLPFRGTKTTADYPWLLTSFEKGRGVSRGTNPTTGAVDTASASARPVTQYTYTNQGRLTQIDQPDGGRTLLTYHAPGGATAASGSTTAPVGTSAGLGYLAQREELDPNAASVKPSRTRFLYDGWGNVTQEHSLLDTAGATERWIVSETEYDFRNRPIRSVERNANSATLGPETRTRYDKRGRICEQQSYHGVMASKPWTLTRTTYDASDLVASEKSWEKSALGTGCATSGGEGHYGESQVQRDPLGNVVQTATRLAPDSWSISRAEYDVMNRMVKAESFADAVSGTGGAAPAVDTSLPTNNSSVSRVWFDTQGRAVAGQNYGRTTGTSTTYMVGSTRQLDYDGLSRVKRTRECLSASAATTPAAPPACDSTLNETELAYNREDLPTDRKVTGWALEGTPDHGLVAWMQFEYDESSRPLIRRVAESATLPITSGCGSGCQWRESHIGYDVMDRVTHSARPKTASSWVVSNAEYDKLGRRVRVLDALGNHLTVAVNNLGLPLLRIEEEVHQSEDLATTLDKKITHTALEFDDLGRPIKIKLQDPTVSASATREILRTLDRRGNVLDQTLPKSASDPASSIYKSIFTYDGFGRRDTSRKHIKAADNYSDGWLDEKFTFDDAGRLTLMEVEPTTGGPGINDQRTSFVYDAQGRRTNRIKPDSREERTFFDSLGRLTRTERTSLVDTSSCGGNSCGCGQGQTRCVALTQFYDNASRLIEVKGQLLIAAGDTSGLADHYRGTTTASTLLQNLVIDGLGRVLKSKAENDPATTTDDVVNHRTFDSFGRLSKEGFSDDSSGTKWTVESLFDAAGRRSSVTYPSFGSASSMRLDLTFDDLNRIRTVVDDHGAAPDETVASFAYVGGRRMVKSTRADGTAWTGFNGSATSWDAASRRTQGAVKKPDGSVLFEEEIKYTIRDEVRAVIWSHGRAGTDSEAQTYTYDDLGRLTQFKQGLWDGALNSGQGDVSAASMNASVSWQLDELGNWRTHDNDLDSTAAFVPAVHAANNFYSTFPSMVDTNADGTVDTRQDLALEMDEVSGFVFKRDELRTGGASTRWLEYKHDLLGRLVEVKRKTSSSSTVLAQYGYDSAGRLAWRCAGECGVSGVQRKWLVYDGKQVVREGTGATGVAPDWSYVWVGSTLLKAADSSGLETYVHHDRLGSVVMQTRNNAGSIEILGRATYDPYGRPSAIPTWAGAPLTVPYGYAGARREDAAGLYLMGARWYDATLGRFIEQDPIGEYGGYNLYAYAGASPTMRTDPSGLKPGGNFPGSPSASGGGRLNSQGRKDDPKDGPKGPGGSTPAPKGGLQPDTPTGDLDGDGQCDPDGGTDQSPNDGTSESDDGSAGRSDPVTPISHDPAKTNDPADLSGAYNRGFAQSITVYDAPPDESHPGTERGGETGGARVGSASGAGVRRRPWLAMDNECRGGMLIDIDNRMLLNGEITPERMMENWKARAAGVVWGAGAGFAVLARMVPLYALPFVSGGGTLIADPAAQRAAANALSQAEAVGRALAPDKTHVAANFMREAAVQNGTRFTMTGGDGSGYTLTQVQGGLDGVAGRYEYLVNAVGQLTHQRFIEGGTINGVINKP